MHNEKSIRLSNNMVYKVYSVLVIGEYLSDGFRVDKDLWVIYPINRD